MQALLFFLLVTFSTAVFAQADLTVAPKFYERFRFNHQEQSLGLEAMMAATDTRTLSMCLDEGVQHLDTTLSLDRTRWSDDVIFPLGSPSALPLCVAVLQLVDRGAVNLEDPVNSLLVEGKLRGGDAVTIQDLLLQRTLTGSGYKPDGYAAGANVPKLLDVARGLRYKGDRGPEDGVEYGTWVLLQLLLEQHYNEGLNAIIQREVFAPVGIEHSFYASELSNEQAARLPVGHRENGTPLRGGYRRHAALGTAGLWSNPKEFAKLTRALIDVYNGRADGLLSIELAEQARDTRLGHRSLLFNLSDEGQPYWGGAVKGYYFTSQAHFKQDWVSACAVNRQLNWQLAQPLAFRLGDYALQLRSPQSVGIVLQASDTCRHLVGEVEQQLFAAGVLTHRIPAEQGVPNSVTATPAFLFRDPSGVALYSGRHDDLDAILQFVELNRLSRKASVPDVRPNTLAATNGRHTVAYPLKWTPPSGAAAPDAWPGLLQDRLTEELAVAVGAGLREGATLFPLDRRMYIDLHANRTTTGEYWVTYALHSQFDCHTPVATNYTAPVLLAADGGPSVTKLVQQLVVDVRRNLADGIGCLPRPLPANTKVVSWGDLELPALPSQSNNIASPAGPTATVEGRYGAELTEADQAGLFFSFPPPLDRYAGRANQLTAAFVFDANRTRVSGSVSVPTASISTTSTSLDEYVLGSLLQSSTHREATLAFDGTFEVPNWQIGVPQAMSIAATLTIRGQQHPVQLVARFTPLRTGSLYAEAEFELDFFKVFGSEGPDGPTELRRRLGFSAAFALQPEAGAR